MDLKSKKVIRKYIIEEREAIEYTVRKEWNIDIFNNLVNSEFYKEAKVIFAFVSFKSEVDTHQIINHAIDDKKIICVPKIKSKEKGIEIFKINSMSELSVGYYGILEPLESCSPVDVKELDLILMPGAAFDRQGGRVGYGMGYYDRFLTNLKGCVDKIALAYDLQILEKAPMDETDVRINGIITNKEIITI